MLIVLFSAFSNTAAVEVVEKYCRVLLHVENHRQICPTGEQIPVCNIILFLPFLSFFNFLFFKLWTSWNIVLLLCTIKQSCAIDSESLEGLRLFRFASYLHKGLVQCHGDQCATCKVEQTVVFLLCLVVYTVMTIFAMIVCRNASRQQKQKASWNRSTFLTSK